MRVAHLVIDGELAGGQLVALQLADALRARGDDALFVSPGPGPFVERAQSRGYRVLRADVGRLHRVAGVATLARLVRREGVDVLHTHTLAAANATGRIAGRLGGARVVSHLHIENVFRPGTELVVRRVDNATARLSAALVAVSEDTRRAYLRQGYPDRTEVVHNGVDLDGTGPSGTVRAELGIPRHAALVVEVGRLCDVKGQRELIEAIADVPDAHAVLVGADVEQGGAFRRELERAADDAGVRDRVVFAGVRDDTRSILAEADVVALPSWTEGLPLVVLEAMAQGRAVVATPVGGTPELVVEGETGLLVPPRDPRALAAALRRLVDDPDLRARLGEAGLARVRERFTTDAMTSRMLEIYDEVVR